MKDLIHNIIIVKNMNDFSKVNESYGIFFDKKPPSRVCIEVKDIPGNVQLECTAFKETESVKKTVLHVQSISEWAPACIGPYSQATSVNQFHLSIDLKRL
jgi:diphthine-ammonia ligase